MPSSYEARIVEAALRLEEAEAERDDNALAEALRDVMQWARALRRDRREEAEDSRVERDE